MAEPRRVNVIFNNELGTVDETEVEAVVAQGGRVVEDDALAEEQLRQEARDSPVLAGTAAAARGASLGLSDVALTSTGLVEPETLQALREENPVAEVVGQGIGIAGSVVGTGGLGGLAQGGARAGIGLGARAGVRALSAPARAAIRGGKAVEDAVRVAIGSRVPASVAKVAAKGAGLAAEGAAFGAGGAITEATLDPDFTADVAVSHVGMGALLGFGLGSLGTIGSEVAGTAVPAAIQAGNKAARKVVGKVAPGASRAGTDAAELGALRAARTAHQTATKKAAAITAPHAKAVAQAITDVQNVIQKTVGKTRGAIPTVGRKAVSTENAAQAATEAVGLSRTLRTAAHELDDTLAGKAASVYDRTIASLPETDVAGRFNAAVKVRNTLANSPTTRHMVSAVDEHLTNPGLFGKAATEWSAARDATQAVFEPDAAFAKTFLDDATGKVSRAKVSEALSGISEGNVRQLDTLRGISTRYDQMLAVVRRGRANAPDVTIPPEFLTENARVMTRFRKAVSDAEKAVTKANMERDAAKSILDVKAGAAAKLAERLLPNNALGRAALKALGENVKGGLPGAILGAAVGVDPFVGGALGNMARIAANPQKFMGMLNRLHEAAGSAKAQHGKALRLWLQDGKDSGKTLRRTANFAPGLRTMLESKSPKEKRKGFVQYREALVEAHTNPEVTAGKLQDAVSPVQQAAPGLAEQIAGASLARLSWLIDNMPAVPNANDIRSLLGEADDISDTDLNRFARVASVVEDPTSILPRITDGTVTREEVAALRETAPGYHRFLLETIAETLPESQVKYSNKLTVGTVFEVPVTGGLTNVQLYQQLLASRQEEKAQPDQLVTRSPTPSSQSQLSPLDAAVNR